MTKRRRQQRETQTQIKRLGVPVTVIDYETVKTDSYGREVRETDESPYTVFAVPGPNGPSKLTFITGDYSQYSSTFYVATDDADTMKGVNPNEELATDIVHQGKEYSIDTIHDAHEAGVVVIGANT